MSEQTVSAGFVRGLLDLAATRGISPAALAERACFDLAHLEVADDRIAFGRYVALMRAAQELCNDPALALHLGESPFAENGIGCMIGSFAVTGAEAFALWNRYSRLCVDIDCVDGDNRFVLTSSGGQLWIVDMRANANEFPELTELTFAGTICGTRRQAGGNDVIKAVHVTHAAPAYCAEYERIFRIPVVFASDKNALLLRDDGWLTEKPQSSSPVVFDVLRSRAEALLATLESATSTKGRVRKLLLPILQTGSVSVEVIAGTLRMSRQTLFRRLRREGTTFERLLDELRRDLALHYLSGKMSVNETTYLLGFSDRAAFTRAFKRWTGTTPGSMGVSKAGTDQTGPEVDEEA